MRPEVASELMRLGATSRFKLLADRLDAEYPGCLVDAAAVPDDDPWIADVVLATLENSGDFEGALRFLRGLPQNRLRVALAQRLADKANVMGKMHTVLRARGRVVTVLGDKPLTLVEGPFEVHFIMDGDRVNAELCVLALKRMSTLLRRHFGADPGPLVVEVHADRARFGASVSELVGRAPPESVAGAAIHAAGRLVVLHDVDPSVDPHSLFLRLGHEYVHVAMRSVARDGQLPAWLDEGLAICMTMELPAHLVELWDRAAGVGLELLDLDHRLPEKGLVADLACATAAVATQQLLAKGYDFVREGLQQGWSTRRWIEEGVL